MATQKRLTTTDQEVSDSYIYLLGRLLVTRQQQLDFREGFKWNELVHRKPGEVDWPNPNLDVAYSEAWVAIDEGSCLQVTVPKIDDRYFTVQFLNGWGETLANINERTFPDAPYGDFAVCLEGSTPRLADSMRRIVVPVGHLRVLLRVALGDDWGRAIDLQHRFVFRTMGSPRLPGVPATLMFEPAKLPGVEAFESAKLALDTEPDINPGMEKLQVDTRAIAEAIGNPGERARIDKVVRDKGWADFAKALPLIGHGTARHGWAKPAICGAFRDDWLTRTLVNFGGIWANVFEEVIYYKGMKDQSGGPLHSDNAYAMTFSADDPPQTYAKYFWSVIAVDSVNRRVLPNPKKRYLLNEQTRPERGKDGSLTLYFADQRPDAAPEGNWLPTPRGMPYNLTFRFYGPRAGVADGTYFPPPLIKQ
jgi:hypothetical protein